MPTESKVGPPPGELAQIVESIFGTMLNLELDRVRAPCLPSADRVTAAVHLAGEWNGALLIECDQEQARRFTGRFLSLDPPDTVDDLVRDALGELANMIGGNLKCVLTHGIRLSMPAVVDGADYSLRVCGAEVRERLAFHCAEGVFWITVLTTPS
jgi:chemotaxis protein CheX